MKSETKTALLLGALGIGAGVGAWLLARNHSAATYSFAGKVVVITGGSRGLGLVLARQLAREGAKLALFARDAEELHRAREILAALGPTPLTCTCDVTDAKAVRDAIGQTQEQLGPVDVLINNAGIINVGPLASMTRTDFEEALAVNFWGCFNTIEAVLPSMKQRRSGRIVNISSIGGKISVPHLLPYCVGKFALVGYSNGLRAELASDRIVVTTVCPGLMRTGSPRNATFKGKHQEEYAWFKISDSLPLLTTSAEDAAHEIIESCRRGTAEIVISTPAKMAVLLQAIFPELTENLIVLANQLLPGPGDAGIQPWLGKESESALTSSIITTLTDAAARKNNELQAVEK